MSDDEKKIINEFAEYLAMSYDKGMRMSVAMTKSETEKFKIKAIYTQFLDAIPKCVESFAEWKEYEKERNNGRS